MDAVIILPNMLGLDGTPKYTKGNLASSPTIAFKPRKISNRRDIHLGHLQVSDGETESTHAIYFSPRSGIVRMSKLDDTTAQEPSEADNDESAD